MELETITLNIAKKTSLETLNSFFKLIEELFSEKSIIDFHIATIVNPNHIRISNNSKPLSGNEIIENGNVKILLEFLNSHKSIELTAITTTSNSCFNNPNQQFNKHNPIIKFNLQPTLAYSTIEINIFRNHPKAQEIITKFIELVEQYYTILDTLTIQNNLLDSIQSEKNKIIESKHLEYDKLIQKETELLINLKKEWNEFSVETQKRLQNQYETNKEKLNLQFQEKEEKFNKEVQEFEDRKKKFDDRERTVVRRELLEKIKGIIDQQSKFDLSEKTIKKRAIVDRICWSVLSLSGIAISIISYTFINNYLTKGTIDWNLLIPSTAFALIFGSTLIFYLRWTSQWFKDHADIEFSNQIFSRDILRASWIVEMFFEWKEQKEFDMPIEIYQAISKNLFNERNSGNRVQHPLEDLLKITGRFSKLKFSKEGIEVENPRKGSE